MVKQEKAQEIVINPIGFVRSEIKKEGLKTTNKEEIQKIIDNMRWEVTSEIVINDDLSDVLDGIDKYSHLIVIFWGHLTPEESRKIKKVHPRGRLDIPERGVLSTWSPMRPNPILVTTVQLLEHNKNVLKVIGLDAYDGSPVLDIKPYNQGYYTTEKRCSDEI
ncbi:MAG: tRNA (N6-threonylcarbamoyladenosine(37)-N6)-methyltransferase TrmO, partial [Chloroflexi bacterium]|nr:tRNA (N6-threonylcarbamoyladenosine(37)-N6)-methyltransferase TrmO [Chloroflexota bacterium]